MVYEMDKEMQEMSPTEFEKWCLKIIKGYAETNKLQGFKIEHNKRIQGSDGTYQIDVYAEFMELGVKFKVLCECKKHRNSIKRSVISELYNRLISTSCQKGIMITTSDYQSGAIEYAKKHSIALIRVRKCNFEYLSHSSGEEKPNENDPFLYGEKLMPPYEAFDCIEQEKIYPTKAMIREIYNKMNEKIKEVLGIDINVE